MCVRCAFWRNEASSLISLGYPLLVNAVGAYRPITLCLGSLYKVAVFNGASTKGRSNSITLSSSVCGALFTMSYGLIMISLLSFRKAKSIVSFAPVSAPSISIVTGESAACSSSSIDMIGLSIVTGGLTVELAFNLFISSRVVQLYSYSQRRIAGCRLYSKGRLGSGSGSSLSKLYTASVGSYSSRIYDYAASSLRSTLGLFCICLGLSNVI
mmetsp:Transcript_52820/g.134241  ORF Transcript_52820/g.134241 Transcript_52820/m.134241 type:complete len:212 (-) Transcript_52820:25-660(-)